MHFSASTSSSSDSESIPRTPVFEEFVESSSRKSRSFSNQGQESPIRGNFLIRVFSRCYLIKLI